ncbi:MAG: shikimate kinase [Clostridia bacterium]|nr:shikimate kinase [Clostridia bacterium]MBQ6704373.1 shikimate kinase [Clostridia bacterium]
MIYLTGMMGSGKSQLGAEAARILGLPFYSTDDMAQQQAGMTISEIFAAYGEEYFRDMESDILQRVSALPFGIVSTGGGIVLREQNRSLMRSTGKILWLHRDIAETAATLDPAGRPLLKDGTDALFSIYQARLPLYRQADGEFRGSTPQQLAEAISKLTAEDVHDNGI